jgi:hypothetical protein
VFGVRGLFVATPELFAPTSGRKTSANQIHWRNLPTASAFINRIACQPHSQNAPEWSKCKSVFDGLFAKQLTYITV